MRGGCIIHERGAWDSKHPLIDFVLGVGHYHVIHHGSNATGFIEDMDWCDGFQLSSSSPRLHNC